MATDPRELIALQMLKRNAVGNPQLMQAVVQLLKQQQALQPPVMGPPKPPGM